MRDSFDFISSERKVFVVFNSSVQQYLKNVIAWLWNIRFKRGDQAELCIMLRGSVGMNRDRHTLEEG